MWNNEKIIEKIRKLQIQKYLFAYAEPLVNLIVRWALAKTKIIHKKISIFEIDPLVLKSHKKIYIYMKQYEVKVW